VAPHTRVSGECDCGLNECCGATSPASGGLWEGLWSFGFISCCPPSTGGLWWGAWICGASLWVALVFCSLTFGGPRGMQPRGSGFVKLEQVNPATFKSMHRRLRTQSRTPTSSSLGDLN
jgi:hypothetical protein